MQKTALVLEGGGFRAQFTAGITDVLVEHGIKPDMVVGVSAGALAGINYVAEQIGRTLRINLAFRDDRRYMGLTALVSSKNILDPSFLYEYIQNDVDPFDQETFNASPTQMFAVASNVAKAQAAYFPVSHIPDQIDCVRASASLPLISQFVWIDGQPYLDGGVMDSVPIEFAIEQGYEQIVVVLTQHRGFIKPAYNMPHFAERIYGTEYNEFLARMIDRHERYNAQREYIWQLEREGKIIVITPPEPVKIDTIERNGEKLLKLYVQGRQECIAHLDEIRNFWDE